MDQIRRVKKGETLFAEGDTPEKFIFVLSGKIQIYVERSGKEIEISTLSTGQVLGEQVLFQAGKYAYSAKATQESQIIEWPMDFLKTYLDSLNSPMQKMLKAMADEIKLNRMAWRNLKMESDKLACPPASIPKLCVILQFIAQNSKSTQVSAGAAAAGNKPAVAASTKIDWGTLKLYTTRFFTESVQRMRSFCEVLKKLGYAELHFVTIEGEQELGSIEIFNLKILEDFAEFYQYQLYRGQKSEQIEVDNLTLKCVKVLNQLANGKTKDFRGAVSIAYQDFQDSFKRQFNQEVKGTHFEALEKKGLFVKRTQTKEHQHIAFDQEEFARMEIFWRILSEIQKWNEKGFVDLNEKEVLEQAPKEEKCGQCSGPIGKEHKFCPNCGFKLAA